MQKKFKIAVLGIGGVGGFVGGKLAAAYSGSAHTEVIFIARGSNAQAIRENGLALTTHGGEMTVRPDVVSDDPSSIGEIDLLLCCTKAYDLEQSVGALVSCITPTTLVLPLLNGADITERLRAVLPAARVLHGCIYLVAKLTSPGAVLQRGEFYSLHFGGDIAWAAEINHVLELFRNAGVNAVLEEDIHGKVWSKFSFISPIATYTSAHDISIGKILESEEHSTAIRRLMSELMALAAAQNVDLPADTIEKNFTVMAKLPYETTSSMHADFAANRSTELETLTGVVVRKAAEKGLVLDAYTGIYGLLRERQQC